MRIAASPATALTIRHPKTAPEAVAVVAPPQAHAVALPARPTACLARHGTPDAGFVMQLIATAATTADDKARPTTGIVSSVYGAVGRMTQPPSSGNRMARSI